MDSSIVLTASSSHLEELPMSTASGHKLDDNNMTHQTGNQDDKHVATLVHFTDPDLVDMQDVVNQMTIATATRRLSMPGQMTQTHNQVIEVLSCDWLNCFLKFTTQEDLVNHVNHCHILLDDATGYCCRWVGCTRNGKRFNAKYKMRIHVRSHTNEKPHQCYICKKCFSRSENLKIHKRSHTGEKPYICSVEGCNKRYSNSSDRFKHSRTHIVDKPYICKAPDCHKCYTDPSSLRKHARSHNHYVAKPENPMSKPVKTVISNSDIVMLGTDPVVMYPVLPTRTTPVLPQMFSSAPQYLPVPHMLSLLQANSLGVRPTNNNTVDSTRTHDLMFNAKVMTTSDEMFVPRSEEQLLKKETASILSTLLSKEQGVLFLNKDHELKSPFKVETSQHSPLTSGQSSSLPTAISTT